FGQLTRLLQHAECQTGTQLTKRAPLCGDSETRTLKGPGEATWASRRAVLTSLREPPSRRMGHFQQVHAAAPLTRRTKSSSSDYLAPQIGLELRAFWLTVISQPSARHIVFPSPFPLQAELTCLSPRTEPWSDGRAARAQRDLAFARGEP